jgi:3-deoxy-D-manno-octulosonate 8-phosphate phosphatase (KDO 8-P phosphatase)
VSSSESVQPGAEPPVSLSLLARAKRVRLVVFDVDGVLTDGRLFLGDQGNESVCFDIKDGLGLVMLRDSGLELAVISGRKSAVVASRMAELGVKHVYLGCIDKLQVFVSLLDRLGLASAEAAYVGDDVPDLPVMERAGLAIAVGDAAERVTQVAHWQTTALGGRGAVREVCELILGAQGRLESQVARFLFPR